MNKPLTIEQLKSLEVGDWVWLVESPFEGYHRIDLITEKGIRFYDWSTISFSECGTKWLAYKNKEMAEISHEHHETGKMAKIVGLCDYNDMTCEQCRLKNNMHVCMHRLSMQKLLDAGYVNIEDRKQKGEIVEIGKYFIEPEQLPNRPLRYLICDYSVSKGVRDILDTYEQAEARLQELRGENDGNRT